MTKRRPFAFDLGINGSRIPMVLLEGAIEDEAERHRAIRALELASLLSAGSFEDGTPAVSLHRLVRATMRLRSEKRGTARESLERLAARLEGISEQDRLRTNESARVTADALDALGRTDEAKALRERYGLEGADPKRS